MKILNEQYLQQRIEELEEHDNHRRENFLFPKHTFVIAELKRLLANCEEFEIETIGESAEKMFQEGKLRYGWSSYINNYDGLIKKVKQ
jgi:hypothetical protein